MFVDLPMKGPILDPYVYDSPGELLAALAERVIGPAERQAEARRAATDVRYTEAEKRRSQS